MEKNNKNPENNNPEKNELEKNMEHSKNKLTVSMFFAISAVIAIASVTIAWFAANHLNKADGLSVEPRDAHFELAAADQLGAFDDKLERLERGDEISFISDKGESITGEVTSDEHGHISWLIKPEGHLGNYKAPKENLGIEPGCFGSLTFYLIPNENVENLTVDFNLNYALYEQNLHRGTECPRDAIVESRATSGGKTTYTYHERILSDNDDYAALMNYVIGHLMFFEECTITSEGNYVYSNLIENSTFSHDFGDVTEGCGYEVTLYWVWPYVLGQALLPEGDMNLSQYHHLFDGVTTEYIKEDMVSNIEKYFYYKGVEGVSVTPEKIESIAVGSADKSFNENNFIELSNYWNYADQFIGLNVGYLSVAVSVE